MLFEDESADDGQVTSIDCSAIRVVEEAFLCLANRFPPFLVSPGRLIWNANREHDETSWS